MTLKTLSHVDDTVATSLQVDSLAKTSATQPIIDKDCQGKGLVFGGKCYALLKEPSQPLFSLKTSVSCDDEDFLRYSEALPKAGLMRNGQLYTQVTLDMPTSVPGSLLLPTPTASTGGMEEIMNDSMEWVLDANLMPRRVHAATGGTFSAGLSRLTRRLVGLPIVPALVEKLMGFPTGWTDCEDLETQSCQTSRNTSEDASLPLFKTPTGKNSHER